MDGDDILIDIDDNTISSTNKDNTTIASDNSARFLSNARISFSDPDLASNIQFAKDYIKKYIQDQRHVTIAQERAESNYSGKP